ncbi:MAG: hypothetical protein MRY74_01760 [Neomegalonema sp.]|nr:hypothetical protein [Neomegalonema sp.]
MPAWLKQLFAPLLIILAAAAIAALVYFNIVDLKAISLPSSPEFKKFSNDLPTIALAFIFGVLGAFVRLGAGGFWERLRQLAIGGAVGVIVFFILKSEVVPQIMYDNLPTKELQVSYYGMALLAVFGGMYSAELSRWAAGKR